MHERLRTLAVASLIATTAATSIGPPASALVTPTGPVDGSVVGSTDPSTATAPATVTNGDFEISSATIGSAVGDGIDESTTWTIDMTGDADLAALPDSGSLESATLLLTLTPSTGDVADDSVAIVGLDPLNPPSLAGLQIGITETIAVDLLEHYSGHDILDALDAAGGTLPMTYSSDAIVSFAEIELVAPTEHIVVGSNAAASELFGFSIAVDGDTAVVGAPGAANAGLPGRAVVLTFDGTAWIEQAVLTAPAPTPDERFGYDVAIENGLIAVGARHDTGSDSGAVYVFTGSGPSWTLDATLSSGLAPGTVDQFGSSVDIDNGRIAVGAPSASIAALFETGGAGWSSTISVTSPGPAGLFGDVVLIDGDELIVGAPIEANNGFSLAGSVYVFDASTGTLDQQINAPDQQNFHAFGTSLAKDGSTLAIGANGDAGPSGFDPSCDPPTSGTCNPGSVYVFESAAGIYGSPVELHASDLTIENNFPPGSQFGLEIDLDGDTLVAGARYNEGRTSSIGKAHVFERIDGTWTARNRLVGSDSSQGDLLGNSVAIVGSTADDFLVGAPNDDAQAVNAGSVYAFGTSVTAPDLHATPTSVDFGEIEIGQTGMALVTVTNVGNRDLVLSSLQLAGDPTISASSPALPLTLAPQSVDPGSASIDVEVTFAPIANGPVSASLTIGSNDPDGTGTAVTLVGIGVEVEDDPVVLIDDLLTFFDTSLADGTLIPQGPGQSAANRAQALRNMIEAASDMIQNGSSPCGQLSSALAKTDGDPTPPDFVAGENAPELAQRINELLDLLGC